MSTDPLTEGPPIADLSGKRILVTGGASGMGNAMVRLAARRGARLAIFDRDQRAMDEARAATGGVHGVVGDVSKPEDCTRAVSETVATLGGLDGIICSAGIGEFMPALEMTPESWGRMIGINLSGVFYSLQAACRAMRDTGRGGSAVVIVSDKAFTGMIQGAHYAAAKAGAVGLVRSFAGELGKYSIRVNALAPGLTQTPILDKANTPQRVIDDYIGRCPMGRTAQPIDMARVACFLLSDESSFVNGQTVHVNGGTVFSR